MATIGKAILSPLRAIGGAVSPDTAHKPGAPGKAIESPGNADVASITQPDAPGQQSAQNYDSNSEEELVFSEPTKITESVNLPNGGFLTRTIHVPAGSKRLSKNSQKVGQTLGAAQKDGSRETSAALASFQWIQWIGVAAFLAGVAGFFHPVVRLALAGRDNALALAGAGLVLVFGPYLFVAYSKYLILALVGWAGFYAWNKYVHLKGMNDAPKK